GSRTPRRATADGRIRGSFDCGAGNHGDDDQMASQNQLTLVGEPSGFLKLGVASRALPREVESGDVHAVAATKARMILAAIDGLGHGVEAATAARVAARRIETAGDESLLLLMQRCHESLIGTRGAVISLASFDQAHATMTWVGVGNVAGVLYHIEEHGQV